MSDRPPTDDGPDATLDGSDTPTRACPVCGAPTYNETMPCGSCMQSMSRMPAAYFPVRPSTRLSVDLAYTVDRTVRTRARLLAQYRHRLWSTNSLDVTTARMWVSLELARRHPSRFNAHAAVIRLVLDRVDESVRRERLAALPTARVLPFRQRDTSVPSQERNRNE